MSTIDTAIEQVLRGLEPASRYQTRHVADRVAKLGFSQATVAKRLLAIAPRCPAGRRDRAKAFTRFGRTCYPWLWVKLTPGSPLVVEQQESRLDREGHREAETITLTDGEIEKIAQRVASLLSVGGELTLATIGPISSEPEECILCNEMFTDGEDGVCRKCLAPEEV